MLSCAEAFDKWPRASYLAGQGETPP